MKAVHLIFALVALAFAAPARAQNVAEYFAAPVAHERAERPLQLSGASLLDVMKSLLGARRSPSGFRGPWCGDVLGYVAKRVGASVPRDYRLARAWARAGRPTYAHAGAVFVMPHHVGVIAEVSGRWVRLVSGNHGKQVAYGWYSIGRSIAIRQV